jgi:hypothetical protein
VGCVGALPAVAVVVVTQDVSRANATLHLLNTGPPNSIAHGEVDADHTTSSVATFTAASLAGADIVYLSPAQLGDLGLTAAEITALVDFVEAGGRLILPADNAGANWYQEFVAIAGAFGTSYSGVSDFETSATVIDHSTPITTQTGGVVDDFVVGPPHQSGITSSEPDFVIVADYLAGGTALGYLPPNGSTRLGDVVFLTDFNTFFDTEIVSLDSHALWTNLFTLPEPSGPGALVAGTLFLMALARHRSHPR